MKRIAILFSLVLLFCSIAVLPSAYAAEGEGIRVEAEAETQTMYYLNIPLKDKKFYFPRAYGADDFVAHLSGTFLLPISTLYSRAVTMMNDRSHTFIFTYYNVKVGEYPLLTSWNIECTVTAETPFLGTNYLIFTVKNDLQINIRSEYYEYFQDADFSGVKITYLYEGEGYLMTSAKGSGHETFTLTGAGLGEPREVSADYDPVIEEGQAPDNGGVVMIPVVRQSADSSTFVDFLTRVFNGTGDVWDYVLFVGILIVVLLLIGLFSRAIAFAFGRRRR